LELGPFASGTPGTGRLAPRDQKPPEPSLRVVTDDPIDGQALMPLEVPHRRLGQGTKAPVDRPRVLAHPDQPVLKRAHAR
jgi:hypothetical protein